MRRFLQGTILFVSGIFVLAIDALLVTHLGFDTAKPWIVATFLVVAVPVTGAVVAIQVVSALGDVARLPHTILDKLLDWYRPKM
jgi:uncharacterized membrane protein SirB2